MEFNDFHRNGDYDSIPILLKEYWHLSCLYACVLTLRAERIRSALDLPRYLTQSLYCGMTGLHWTFGVVNLNSVEARATSCFPSPPFPFLPFLFFCFSLVFLHFPLFPSHPILSAFLWWQVFYFPVFFSFMKKISVFIRYASRTRASLWIYWRVDFRHSILSILCKDNILSWTIIYWPNLTMV